jgi:hypothetical protein
VSIPPALTTPASQHPQRVTPTPEDVTDDDRIDIAPKGQQHTPPSQRRDEVSAEVPKLGVSGESHRATDLETPTFEKNKA